MGGRVVSRLVFVHLDSESEISVLESRGTT